MRPILFLLMLAFISTHAFADAIETEQQFHAIGDMPLVSGETLEDVMVGYRTVGALNATRSNVIVFLTWFTGTSEGMIQAGKIGPGALANTDRYYVIVVDALGNGVSTSPSNSHRQPGKDFPAIAIDDMVRAAHALVTKHLGFDRVHAVMGISMGGMQTFQWIGQFPGFMDKAVAIDGSPRMTTYDLAQWGAHEEAIETMRGAGIPDEQTMAFVGSITMLTLWTPDYFVENIPSENWPEFRAGFRQGTAQADPNDYLAQLRAMMSHDVYADHAAVDGTYEGIVQAELLVIGVPSDHMVNPEPARALAESLGALYVSIESDCGHVGSSCEEQRAAAIVNKFLGEAGE